MTLLTLLRVLRWGDYPGVAGQTVGVIASVITRGRQRFHYSREEGNVTSKAESGAMASKAKESRKPLGEKEARKIFFPGASRRKQPCGLPDLSLLVSF